MIQSTVSQALSSFLKSIPYNYAIDITNRYSIDMEVQIMVDPIRGKPVWKDGSIVRNTWTPDSDTDDGEHLIQKYGSYQFFHIRIPRNSMSNPTYTDIPMKYPLGEHVECVGMTGWNWGKRQSEWVAFDVDAITGHAVGVGINNEIMAEVKERACSIPWVQVRKSTGGGGLHFYVYFNPKKLPETENHTVHQALARCVLGLMEKETGFDFRGNMDVLGGNMWIWHRKINLENRGLELIKNHDDYCPELPNNWRDNLEVIHGKTTKIRVHGINDKDYVAFENQASSRTKIIIDEVHKQIEENIADLGYSIVWIPDHHCWQTHSKAFEELHEKYPEEYLGIYKTLSKGENKGKPNSFVFPMQNGGMKIVRFGKGTKEHETWIQDGLDWTWTYFNKSSTLYQAAAFFDGSEDPDGKGWIFTDIENVKKVTASLGDRLPLEDSWVDIFGETPRNILLRSNKNNQLVVEMDKNPDEKTPKGWIDKGRKFIKLLRNASTNPIKNEENLDIDNRVRAVVDTNNEFSQWMLLNEDGDWIVQTKDNVRSALRIWSPGEGEDLLGRLIIRNWKVVNVPFQPEYLGHRLWNRCAPHFNIMPGESGSPHPNWDSILEHCGQDLDNAISTNMWCRENGIMNGADYLAYWLAFVFRDPYCKLPYLFFYGPQNSGKSTFHEAVSLLVTRGVQIADEALRNANGFNGELAGAVLCIVEETNLSTTGSMAYNRMKAFVTGEYILIHPKRLQPYMVKNTTHWIQCANCRSYVPIFPGDTRITIFLVPMPDGPEIPKDLLMEKLKLESPAFLRTLLDIKLPPPPGRLRLPVIATESKIEAEREVESLVDKFLFSKCYYIPGAIVKFSDFYTKMCEWMSRDQAFIWTYHKVCNEFRIRDFFPYVFGRALNNISCIGNLSFDPNQEHSASWIRKKQRLEREENE